MWDRAPFNYYFYLYLYFYTIIVILNICICIWKYFEIFEGRFIQYYYDVFELLVSRTHANKWIFLKLHTPHTLDSKLA